VSALDVRSHGDADIARLSLHGELDLASVAKLDDELSRIEADRAPVVVVDLSGLEFMDSSGLRALIIADERARGRGARLAIVPGPPQVRRIFEVTKLNERLELVENGAAVSG